MADYSRRKHANKKSIRLVVIVMLIFAAILVFQIIRVSRKNQDVEYQMKVLEERLALEEERNALLEAQKDRELTAEEKIRLARIHFGLMFPNEILFVPDGK